MPFVVTAKAGGGVPAGVYAARFDRAEAYDEGEYGPGCRLVWTILDGDLAGQEANRIVSLKLSPKSNLWKFVKSIVGREPEPGENIDLSELPKATGSIVVEELEGGSTRVSAFIRTA